MKMKIKISEVKEKIELLQRRLEALLRLVKVPGFGGVPLHKSISSTELLP